MRAAPAFQVTVDRFGSWRLTHLVMASLTTAVLSAWFLGRHEPVALAGVAAAAVVWLAFAASSLRRLAPFSLRWDTQRWHLGSRCGADRGTDGMLPGQLVVALDLGGWMLLKFVPEPGTPRTGTVWLALQRRGLESRWHALRCAVYGARPGSEAAPPVPAP